MKNKIYEIMCSHLFVLLLFWLPQSFANSNVLKNNLNNHPADPAIINESLTSVEQNVEFKRAFLNLQDFEKDSSRYKVLVFLSIKCPCSNSHIPHLNDLFNQYKNIKFYGVIADVFETKNKLALEGFYSEENIKYPVIRDDDQILIRRYGALKTPDIRILKKNSDSTFEVIYEGGVTEHLDYARAKTRFLEQNLISISKNTELKFRFGRSLGCYIRRI